MTPEEFAKAPLSAVIRAALDDLAKVEADPRYVVDMNTWHGPGMGGCHVCLAGAVMAGSMGVPIKQHISAPIVAVAVSPKGMQGDVADGALSRLMALDMVRSGDISDALIWIGATPPKGVWRSAVTPYSVDHAIFKHDLLAVAAALEAEGL